MFCAADLLQLSLRNNSSGELGVPSPLPNDAVSACRCHSTHFVFRLSCPGGVSVLRPDCSLPHEGQWRLPAPERYQHGDIELQLGWNRAPLPPLAGAARNPGPDHHMNMSKMFHLVKVSIWVVSPRKQYNSCWVRLVLFETDVKLSGRDNQTF